MAKEKDAEFIPRIPSIMFFMDVSDLQELLGQVPSKKKMKILEKMIVYLSEYHLKCHEAQVILGDKLDRLIRSKLL